MRKLALYLDPNQRVRNKVRIWRDEFFDQQVRQLRRTARKVRRGEVDVLWLGDSAVFWVGLAEKDQRRLIDMVADGVGPDTQIAAIMNAGYSAALYSEFIRILCTLKERPRAVVVSLCVRTSTSVNVTCHPVYGYTRSLETLRGVDRVGRELWRVGPRHPIGPADYERFDALPVVTRWSGPATIGDLRTRLRGDATSNPDLDTQRAFYDYFHGEVVRPGNAGLDDWGRLGKLLRAYGVPVIAYRVPIPIERGETLYPNEFADHVNANCAAIDAAFAATVGPCVRFVPPVTHPAGDFLNVGDGIEHLNDGGRRILSQVLATEIRDVLKG